MAERRLSSGGSRREVQREEGMLANGTSWRGDVMWLLEGADMGGRQPVALPHEGAAARGGSIARGNDVDLR